MLRMVAPPWPPWPPRLLERVLLARRRRPLLSPVCVDDAGLALVMLPLVSVTATACVPAADIVVGSGGVVAEFVVLVITLLAALVPCWMRAARCAAAARAAAAWAAAAW